MDKINDSSNQTLNLPTIFIIKKLTNLIILPSILKKCLIIYKISLLKH